MAQTDKNPEETSNTSAGPCETEVDSFSLRGGHDGSRFELSDETTE